MNKEIFHEVFEHRCTLSGHCIAISEPGMSITFDELNAVANRLAGLLLAIGAERQAVVGVAHSGAVRQIQSLLGIFKAGAVYMPLDESFSAVRLQQMFTQTGCDLLITDHDDLFWIRQRLESVDIQPRVIIVLPSPFDAGKTALTSLGDTRLPEETTLLVKSSDSLYDESAIQLSSFPDNNPSVSSAGSDSCYVFYTSGSTGQGKGILGSHRSLSHYIDWHTTEFKIAEGTRISQVAPYSFDASLKDILTALAGGATVCSPGKEIKENLGLLAAWLDNQRITLLQTVPSVFRMLTATVKEKGMTLPALAQVVLAGERLYGRDVINWRETGSAARLSNLYGLTETTILKSCYHLEDREYAASEMIPVGKAIPGTSIVVISEDMICDEGEIGEVYIKSPYMTKGYVDETLNESLFVQNPLVSDRRDIVCRTGDIGRYRPDGNLEIIGRKDEQVKIGGVRVEPGEIRTAMLSLPGVEQAEIVIQQDTDYNQEMICYYLGKEQDTDSLRLLLSGIINRQLIPSFFIWLKEFPVNINGKIDKKALPRPASVNSNTGGELPTGLLEQGLAGIWAQVLGYKGQLRRDDSFFAMGGSSLKAIQLISRIYKEYEVQLTIADVFDSPVLRVQAELIGKAVKKNYTEIEHIPGHEYYDLSYSQRRLWVLDQLNDSMIAYSRPAAFVLRGNLELGAFQKALLELVSRHEILRTVFKDVNGEPRQFVLDKVEQDSFYHYHDLRDAPDKKKVVTERLTALSRMHYDLKNGPLFNTLLLRTEENEYELLLGIHHIISDEWSLQVMMREVAACYNNFLKGGNILLEPLKIQYRDYAAWQKKAIEEAGVDGHKGYWLNKLSGELPVLELQTDYVRPAVQTFNGRQVRTIIGKEEYDKLKTYCEGRGATLFMGLAALVKSLLYRYTEQTDIIIGTPVAGRDHPDLEGQIGFYVNTLALRTEINGAKGFETLLSSVKQTTLEALEHEFYPFDKLVDELNLARDISRSPVFDVALVLQNIQLNTGETEGLDGIEISQAHAEIITSLYDLTFWFTETTGGLVLNLEFNTDIFAEERTERMLQHFRCLYSAVLNQPKDALCNLEYITASEKNELLYDFNATESSYPADKTLVDLFERQAGERGFSKALVCGENTLTYEEINIYANRLAHYLRHECGIKPDQLVGLLMERSEWMVIGMLGILKAGGAYVPIDITYPPERTAYILEDSLTTILVTDQPGWEEKYTCIDPSSAHLDELPGKNLSRAGNGESLAYVIYTSGSTGRPKGVMIQHRSVVNFLYSVIDKLTITPMDRWLSVTTCSFDISVLEIFAPLVSGASLILAGQSDISKPGRMMALMDEEEPSIMQATPSFWSLLIDAGWKGEHNLRVLVGGEALPYSLGKRLRRLCGTLLNMYGPTETTIWSTFKRIITDEDCLLIGRPLANTTLYILDGNHQLMPKGIPGKLYIGGHGLARGYYRQPELTASKFIRDPYNKGGRIYDTGDRCVWTETGELRYLGRTDFMVKLRGYRIELGEIEQALLENSTLHEAVAVLRNVNGEGYIVVYYTTQEEQDAEQLAAALRKRLPEYMVPSYFVRLEKLPVNANGKVDRKALPQPENIVDGGYAAPRNNTESKLAAIWEEVLGKERTGVNDNFFNSGGHSLRAIQVISRVYREFGVQLELKDIFLHPVLADQALLIRDALPEVYRPVEKVADSEYYDLSHSQYRLWLLDKIEGISNTYVIPASYRIRGNLQTAYLEQSLNMLIERHEILRTIFIESDGLPVQSIKEVSGANLTIGVTDLRGKQDAEALAQEEGKAFAMKPFLLNEWPLMRAHIWQVADHDYLFFFSIHHIITDEWSMQVLIREWLDVYNAYVNEEPAQLPPLRLQYRDYAAWHSAELTGERLQFHKSFWMGKLGDDLPVLELPADFSRPHHKTYNGGQVSFQLAAKLVSQLRKICENNGASSFMGFTALINALLYRYSGAKDIIIGTPVAGREHPDLEGQLGFFVNNLVLRNTIDPDKGFIYLLETVKKNMLDAFRHQAYPFDRLVEDLDLVRDSSRNPIFDVLINWQNAGEDQAGGRRAAGIEVDDNIFEPGVTKADITFLLKEQSTPGEDLYMVVEYNTDLFRAERIQRMLGHFLGLLKAITDQPDTGIARLNFMNDEELAVIKDFGFKSFDFPSSDTLVSLFEKKVNETPGAIALIFESKAFTYAELNSKVNLLAQQFLTNGTLGPGRIGAILLERSEWAVITALAVLKTGAAYLPIDPAYPAERVQYMLKDAAPNLLVTESHYLFNLPDAGTTFFVIDFESENLSGNDKNPGLPVRPTDLAYIIYTSGSTGEPKGVMVEHKSCVNMLWNEKAIFNITAADKVLQYSSFSFDGAVAEMFVTFSAGATLVVTPASLVKDAVELVKYMQANGVTMVIWPTAFLSSVNQEAIQFLKKIISAGDVANVSDAINCSRFLNYYNCYGPTEGTVWATYFNVQADRDATYSRLPIGRPIGNVGIYILNEALQPQPLGIPGEICISGEGLARGYLGRPGLTAEKFVDNPFGSGKMYRTGDIGAWMSDGNIDFTGRKDDQAKIRGYRIETGEIEQVMLQHNQAEQAVVKVFGEKSEKYLAAYYSGPVKIKEDEMRAFLSQRLPEYMMPSYFIQLDTMPVNASGKINRRALPKPEFTRLYVAPRTDTEKMLSEVCSAVLKTDRLSIEDNFFSIGGQSLKAIQVVNELSKRLDRQVKVAELFEYPQLSDFARRLDSLNTPSYEAILPVPQKEHYPLTHGQRRFWVLEQFEGMSAVYVLPASYWLRGSLDSEKLQQAFNSVIERHESLRTVFHNVNGKPVQVIMPASQIDFSIQFEDYYPDNEADARTKALARMEEESIRPFNLAKGPLFRVLLSRTAAQEFLLTLSIHHIISDEWSLQVMIHEVLSYYTALIKGETCNLISLKVQYKDYAAWQQSELQGDKLTAHRDYWLNKLAGELPQLQFPTDRPRLRVQTFNGSQYRHNFSEALSQSFQEYCKEKGATLFMGLVALTDTLLYRYTGQGDIIIGSPVAGREHPDLANQIGYFVNTLPIRQEIKGEQGFENFLAEVKSTVQQAFKHQVYPFDKLVDELDVVRDISRAPVFDIVVVLQNAARIHGFDAVFEGVEVEECLAEVPVSKIDLRLFFTENEQSITLTLDYNTDLFNGDRMQRLALHLEKLMEAVLANPSTPLQYLDYIPAQEKQLLLEKFNPAPADSYLSRNLVTCFEKQAAATPDATALVYGEQEWTYRELNGQINKLAYYLRQNRNVTPATVVGVMTDRNEWMVISSIAVLKAGGVYLPVDPSYPQERISYMLEDSKASLLISESAYLFSKPDFEGETFWADIELAALEDIYENPAHAAEADDPAYIVYTSGSTGKPKGVIVAHRSCSNLLYNQANTFGVSPADKILQFSSIAFDGSFFEIVFALCHGAALILVPGMLSRDGLKLVSYMEAKGVTVAILPSAFLDTLELDKLRFLRVLVTAGDVANMKSAVYCSSFTFLYNGYGPTESTVWAAGYRVEPADTGRSRVPIGKPVLNSAAYVLDEHQQLLPVGVPGELCLTGASLATGYINNPILTDEKFVPNPFGKGKLYRTGDRVCWLADGNLDFIGRADNQIKIRGYRIETDEIEKIMMTSGEVELAAIAVFGNDNAKYLAGYYTTTDNLSAEELKTRMLKSMPEYMVPSYIIRLEVMPLNSNGKVDRKKLPPPGRTDSKEYVAPRTDTEKELSAIWKEILNVELVGAEDNFFAIGGNSLRAVQMISQVYKRLDAQVAIGDVFNHPVLSALAVIIDNIRQTAFAHIQPIPDAADYPLSYSQQRLWLQEQYRQEAVPYNAAGIFSLKGNLDKDAFENAFCTLVKRHESLRTVFVAKGDVTRQKVKSFAESGFRVVVEDLRAVTDPVGKAKDIAGQLAALPFDLSNGPLLKVSLLQTHEEEYLFILGIHHIISDEWSMQVMLRELVLLYNAYTRKEVNPLEPLPIQYRDYAAWEADELSGERLEQHRSYWLGKLSAPLPVLQIPTDKPRPPVQTFNGDHFSFVLSKEQADGLKQLCLQHQATLFMGLSALIKVLLYQYSGQTDIIIGTPIAGRDHPDLDNQIGYYLNTIAIRTQLDTSRDFGTLLDEEKKNVLEGFRHQAYPFDRLVEELNLEPDPSRAPVFDVTLILQNIQLYPEDLGIEGIQSGTLDVALPISKGDLRFQFTEQPGHIDANIEFNTDLFNRSRVERMVKHIRQLLDSILANTNAAIQTLSYRDKAHDDIREKFLESVKVNYYQPVARLFEKTATKYPEKVAAECNGETVSYSQLNEETNKLMSILCGNISDGSKTVVVLLPPGIKLVQAMIAIFKAGFIYVPVDRSFSPSRLRQIFEETAVRCLITGVEEKQWILQHLESYSPGPEHIIVMPVNETSTYQEGMKESGGRYIFREMNTIPGEQVKAEEVNDDAYIFYTSGSTGKGKGILGSHQSLSQYSLWHANHFSFKAGTRVSQVAPISFDASLKDIWPALISGATVCIAPPQVRENMGLLGNWLQDSGINILQTVPSVFRMLARSTREAKLKYPSLRQIVLAGERLVGRDVESWREAAGHTSQLSNMYGLTETTILKSCFDIGDKMFEPGEAVPVGTPINEAVIAVISDGRICSEGEIGEVYIKSPYVTRGYLQKELNENLFVQNPLQSSGTDIVCRTGDTGRYLEDGNLEILGRRDEQVKIGGVRIEPGEVRHALFAIDGIEQVELSVHQHPEGEAELICYYTGNKYNPEELRKLLLPVLNRQLIPAYYSWLPEFPLNINGKVDKRRLPKPEALLLSAGYEEPLGETERKLGEIWQQVLGTGNRIGRKDNFFLMGGSSLKAIQLISRIYREFDVQLTIAEIFNASSLSMQGEIIEDAVRSKFEAIMHVEDQPYYSLSFAQRRLWIQETQKEGLSTYNIPMWYRLKGDVQVSAFEKAFAIVIERHESLRTVFEVRDGEPVQRILTLNETGFSIQFEDISNEKDAEAKAASRAELFCTVPFRLNEPPLLRVKLIHVSEEDWVLAIVIHHIIADEWSMQVLAADLIEAYNTALKGTAPSLPVMKIQYRDYVAWQKKELDDERLSQHRQYWLSKLEGEIPVMEIPADNPRPALQTFNGSQLQFTIPSGLYKGIRELCEKKGVTLFMGLTAALHTLLYHYSGQHDQLIGTPVAGRDHPDLESQVGYYLNTVVMRTKLDSSKSFLHLLDQVKKTALEAFDHRVYPFDLLVEELNLNTDLSRSPLFDVAIILQNIQLDRFAKLEMQGVAIEPVRPDTRISKGDLRFQFTAEGDVMTMDIEYNTDIYNEPRISKMADHFIRLASSVLNEPGQSLNALEYLSTEEKQAEKLQAGIFGSAIDAEF